ncbi:hypothetical protein ACWCV9_20505 [Streptomyces sp. NPDC001606]
MISQIMYTPDTVRVERRRFVNPEGSRCLVDLNSEIEEADIGLTSDLAMSDSALLRALFSGLLRLFPGLPTNAPEGEPAGDCPRRQGGNCRDQGDSYGVIHGRQSALLTR